MTKELFVSATPHEIKVSIVEDDQLAEVYLERENEYTLAGSIYKGRVTRVLPGMQSAFVDIGLERDAFLYVSDFMELENEDGDLEEIPASPVQDFSRPAVSEPVAAAGSHVEAQSTSYAPSTIESHASEPRESGGGTDQRDSRGGWRGRRRRGRRDHSSERGSDRSPERGPERSQEQTRFSRPLQNESRPEREHYGPPPGYQPIILPGESISKYRGLSQPGPAVEKPAYVADETPETNEPVEAIAQTFPQDEPLFAEAVATSAPTAVADVHPAAPTQSVRPKVEESEPQTSSEAWDREQKRLHEMNVAATFGGEAAVETEDENTEEDQAVALPEHSEQPVAVAAAATAGTVEEEEIDEEEADISSYVDELEEDAAFDEYEEETHAAGDSVEPVGEREITASAGNGSNAVPFSSEPSAIETA